MGGLQFLFLAPVLLLPAIIALWTKKRASPLICVLNVVAVPAAPALVGLMFSMPVIELWAARGMFSIAAGVAVWLALLHMAISKDKPTLSDVDEDVKLVPYDAAWPETFERERRRIAEALTSAPVNIEHIGSTAVPGLAAKPVIDMMLGVADLDRVREPLSRLQILGYENLGEAGVPGRVYLRSRGDRDFNLHVVVHDGEHWTNNLALRDLLRNDPLARADYLKAKNQAIESGATRLLAYSAAKQAALTALLARARASS